jgi:dual specificity protein kinase YAK1
MQYGNSQRLQNQAQAQMRQHQTQPRLPSHGNGMQSSMSTGSVYPSQSGIQGPYPPPVANPPPTSYYPTTRNRANTINQMDQIPPALARLTHLGVQDPAGTRSSLTPVLNRDEAIREWERRGHAKKLSINPNNPQLEYLQEQAELAGQAWGGNYGGVQQYPMQPALTSTMDEYQRTNRIGQHRANASSSDFGFPDPSSAAAAQARGLASPRRHHGGGGGSISNPNYLPAFPPPAASAFDSYDPRGDASLALMYTPLQPNAAGRNQMAASGHRQASSMHHPYGTHNPFAPPGSSGTSPILPQVHLSPAQAQQQAARRASGQYGGGGFGDYEA